MPEPTAPEPTTVAAGRRAAGALGWTSASWEAHDGQSTITTVTLLGVAAAVVLAIVGGMPFDLPMPTWRFGWVEPTCGLTRGSTAIARGDLGRAYQYNPASFAVMAFGLYGVGRAALGWLTGRWLTIRIHPSRWGWLAIGLAVLVLWAHQQSNADFVMHARG